jgi:hypothetical protein
VIKKSIGAVFLILTLTAVVLLVLRFTRGGAEDSWVCDGGQWVKHGNPAETKPTGGCELIGGQKDEHGCLGPAGYSWCEVKQKCLRVWEEPCEETSELLDYKNSDYGFSLKLPKTWEDYKVNQGTYPNYSYVGFSFGDNHQPFTIFQIVRFSKEQWDKGIKSPSYKIIGQNDTQVLVCDGCCTETEDTTGGGQFDSFQVARCKEVPEILKTFVVDK